MDLMWNNYDKLSIDVYKLLDKIRHQEIKLSFCGPQANEVSSILWLVMNAPLYSIIPPLISHFEQAQFMIILTIVSFKFGEALKSLNFRWRFINSKYQTCKNCKYELSTQVPVWKGPK